MAEWLGNGLQNRVQQFDSAWYLKLKPQEIAAFFFLMHPYFRKIVFREPASLLHTL